jgi:RNA polymerase sigma factor (sigma-70 family)
MKYFNETFIKECQSADRKAQKELFEQLYSPMFRICSRYVVQHPDAEDCMMRGFMKAFQNLERFRYEGEHSLFTWVRRIMVNESLMFLRQRHNFLLSLDEQLNAVSLPAEALQQIDAEELNHMILQLPTGYRTVFNLNAVEGYDHKTIAGLLGISESTSRTQLAKAKTKLKYMLEQTSISNEKFRK